jgi:hypothetical protein
MLFAAAGKLLLSMVASNVKVPLDKGVTTAEALLPVTLAIPVGVTLHVTVASEGTFDKV